MAGMGFVDRFLSAEEVRQVIAQALEGWQLSGRRVLVVIPDSTRTAPIPQVFRVICDKLRGKAAALDFLIALGTHRVMNIEQINGLVGAAPGEWSTTLAGVRVLNHEWDKPETFLTLGTISAEEVSQISGGMLHQSVPVRVNRLVNEYDCVIVCGPVFPHEVVGFSGGNKYFFPGISGPELIDLSHWLGALITSYAIIGKPGITPVRQLIHRAADLITTEKRCLAMVVAPGSAQGAPLAGLYTGTPEAAWAEAVTLSAQLHVKYVERPYRQVLSVMPHMYDDIWTAAKGMYKMEPVIEDGGEVIIYAPHITEFSYTHGKVLAEVGYHVRDYFVKQWSRFKGYPGGVLAHSTHLRGIGTFDPIDGEKPRIKVTLATGISAERCAAHNLSYLDPDSIHVEDWENRESEGVLLVPKAGEMLYRLKVNLKP